MMRTHDWSEPDAERVRTCRRPGCGVQQTPAFGPFRSFAWRRGPGDTWHIGVLECVAEKQAEPIQET